MQNWQKKDIGENFQTKSYTWNWKMQEKKKKVISSLYLLYSSQSRENEKDLRKKCFLKADGALKIE